MSSDNRELAERLQKLIEEASGGLPVDYDLWRERARAELASYYGDPDHKEVKRFVNSLFPGLAKSSRTVATGKFAAAQERGLKRGVAQLLVLVERLQAADGVVADVEEDLMEDPDATSIWVVHGRNLIARDGMFAFLRALGLRPLEWDQAVSLTGKGAPYVGEVLDQAFQRAAVVLVLMTPDEVAYLRQEFASGQHDPDTAPSPQARPNVLFEAGMALGRDPDRTIIVEMGAVRGFSDIAGRHVIRLDGLPQSRKALADRLRTAGAAVDTTGADWLKVGDLSTPEASGPDEAATDTRGK